MDENLFQQAKLLLNLLDNLAPGDCPFCSGFVDDLVDVVHEEIGLRVDRFAIASAAGLDPSLDSYGITIQDLKDH